MAGFNLGDIIVTIKAKTDDLQRGLSDVQAMANKTRDFGSGMRASLDRAADGSRQFAVGIAAAGTAVVGLGVAGVASAASFEQSRIAFETMLGSADKARSLMNDIAKFAKETPFELPEVVAGSKQLLAFGFAQEQIIPTMRKLGDLASGLGVPVGQLTNVFGQVKVAGRLMGQDLLQFTNAGVPLIAALADTMKKPQNEIKKLVEEGKVGFPEVEAAMNSLTGEGSKFGGMMEKQSKSFNGVVSNIKDGFGQFLRTMVGITNAGDIIEGGLFYKVKQASEKLLPLVARLPEILADAFNKIKPFIPALVGAILGGLVPAFYAWATATWAAFAPLAPFIAAGAVLAAGIHLLVNAFTSWGGVIGFIGKLLGGVVDVVTSLVNIVKVLVTGDFNGGIFGLAEDDPWLAVLFKARDVLKWIADFIGDQLKSVWQSLSSIGSQLAKSFEPVINLFKQILANKAVQTVLKVIAGIIAAYFAGPLIGFVLFLMASLKILAALLKFVADHFEGIKKVVLIALAVAFLPVTIIIGTIIALVKNWGAIMGWFKDVFESVANFIVSTWQTIYNAVSTAVTAIWNVISPILEFIKNVFIIVFGTIAIIVVTTLQGIWAVVSTVFNAIWGIIGPIMGFIYNSIINGFQVIYNMVVGTLQALFGFIQNIWNMIYGAISGVVGAIINFFAPAASWLYNKGRDIVMGLANGIRSLAGEVWNGIKSVADKIGQFFGGAAGWLWDVGRAIVMGLVNGIRSAIGWVNDAAGNVAETVKNKLKNVLGIRSPSKVFMQYGVNINEGLVKGLEKSAQMVQDAMTIPSLGMNPAYANMAAGQADNSVRTNTNVTNINGPIHIGSKQDANYLMQKFDRNIQLEEMGLATDE